MREKRDKTVLNVGTRLAILRKEKGLTQGEFCQAFSDYCNYEKCLLVPSVSSWEQNRRLPTMQTLVMLAQYYGVSIDYLFGITDERNAVVSESVGNETTELIKHSDVSIRKADLVKHNGMPVYIKFRSHEHLSQWGILNANTNKVICKDFVVPITADVECYSYAPLSPVRTQIYEYQKLLDTPYVWIEIRSADEEIRASYNGRYRHNENHTALVNLENGLTLPYHGLDVSFWAFRA